MRQGAKAPRLRHRWRSAGAHPPGAVEQGWFACVLSSVGSTSLSSCLPNEHSTVISTVQYGEGYGSALTSEVLVP